MGLPRTVTLVEVGARDGLQAEPVILPAATRARFIDLLGETGLAVIEAGAFVSPARVPQMADSDQVLRLIHPLPGRRYPVLVPNLMGLERAVAAGATEVAVLSSASEGFANRNLGCSVLISLERAAEVAARARLLGLGVRAYVSCALDCPYDGKVAPERAAEVARALLELGAAEISLADTIGTATPGRIQALVDAAAALVPVQMLAVHFHDTWGQALANVLAALERGIAIVDASAAGLGGCPFAPGASGNLASEDLLYMLDGLGIATGVDLPRLAEAGRFICAALDRPTHSRVAQAMGKLKTVPASMKQ